MYCYLEYVRAKKCVLTILVTQYFLLSWEGRTEYFREFENTPRMITRISGDRTFMSSLVYFYQIIFNLNDTPSVGEQQTAKINKG